MVSRASVVKRPEIILTRLRLESHGCQLDTVGI